MKLVIQRVKETSLVVNNELISEINRGLAIYVGVEKGDTEASADYLAKKAVNMRIFEDENGKMNLSVLNKGYEILAISQFTLLADCSHGNRPGFANAESPDRAEELYKYFGLQCEKLGVTVKYGVFGADMKISQLNDGPVTIIIEKK